MDSGLRDEPLHPVHQDRDGAQLALAAALARTDPVGLGVGGAVLHVGVALHLEKARPPLPGPERERGGVAIFQRVRRDARARLSPGIRRRALLHFHRTGLVLGPHFFIFVLPLAHVQ